MPSRKEFAFPKGNISSRNKATAFWLLSWTLKKWKVKNVQKQGVWETSDVGRLEAVCVFDNNHWRGGPWE